MSQKPDSIHPHIVQLVDDELGDLMPGRANKSLRDFFLKESQEAYVETVARAQELGIHTLSPTFDKLAAEIGFLRGFRAFTRLQQGKPVRKARSMSS
ncbi:hypothetical protein HYW59_00110 [Candidatus Kaiserbacteria bacterium]|nr:hypothetical protein [Candidatus Kaiserbacteria bacterium]